MPPYDVGGDWFDYADNREGVWLAIGDAVGKGNRAASLAAVNVARFGRRAGAARSPAGRRSRHARGV